jgi:tungstate transport system ATP-binding protein
MIPAYHLTNLSFSYGDKPVLEVTDMKIPAGEIVAVTGPNGSGKTTLLHLLAFIFRPRTGEVRFFGEKGGEENLLSHRRRVGLLLQQPYLFKTTVIENVVWGLRARGVPSGPARERARAALEQVGLSGFETRRARALSGGETQAVALARALVLDPEVLLLDEPSNHLDSARVRRTEEIFLEANRRYGKTVIFTTHDPLQGAALSDRVLSIFRGKPVQSASENLFKGRVLADGTRFDTGGILIPLSSSAGAGSHVAIDPNRITLCREDLDARGPNSLTGRVVGLHEESGKIRVEVAAGERIQVLVAGGAWNDRPLELGQRVRLDIEEDAVTVLP